MVKVSNKVEVVKAPGNYEVGDRVVVFLGGSIEMGAAEPWQEEITKRLKGAPFSKQVLILNPRRDDWDSTWKQEIGNPQFNEQVTWELKAQEIADLLIYYFAGGTKSPITFLELGAFGAQGSSIVYCSPEFWRKGNIDIFCDRYGIPCYSDKEEFYSVVVEDILNR